jgi:hypothetical protein
MVEAKALNLSSPLPSRFRARLTPGGSRFALKFKDFPWGPAIAVGPIYECGGRRTGKAG